MTMREFLDQKLNQNLSTGVPNLQIMGMGWSDPLFIRLFKSKNDYYNRGKNSAAKDYEYIFPTLEKKFGTVKSRLKENDRQKQLVIDKLTLILENLKDNNDDELNQIYTECEKIFMEDTEVIKNI